MNHLQIWDGNSGHAALRVVSDPDQQQKNVKKKNNDDDLQKK